MNDEFRKMVIKAIKKTDKYRLLKREIGKIKDLQFSYIENKVLRAEEATNCERTEFQITINHKLNCTMNIYTDGTIEIFD